MQILSIALTNFKTHKEQQFQFQPGTNAICGENGAGKTSILEAIAWVLFNYQGNYTKEDLIRNGASSAQVRVAFVSSRDSRTYEVQRSTTSGYTLFDPQLNERLPYTRTKDEVLPWLRQHLGVAPGTDLGQLFANTIGVPQGTFTADFLLSPEKRKPIFDIILKVEEYRETYRQSNSLRKYAEARSQRLKDLLEQYEESLQSWDDLQSRHRALQLEITQGKMLLAELEAKGQQLAKQRTEMMAQAEQVQIARSQQQTLMGQIEAQQQICQRISLSLAQAQQAAEICRMQQRAYTEFESAEAQLKTLNFTHQARQQLLQQQQQCQKGLNQSQQTRSRLEAQLEQFAIAAQELASLAPAVATQERLEAERITLQQQAQAFVTLRLQQQQISAQANGITQEITQLEREIQRLSVLQAELGQALPQWEAQQSRLQEQMSRIEAAQQFESELRELIDNGQAQQSEYRQQVGAALKVMEGWVSKFASLTTETIAPVKEALFQGGVLSKSTLTSLNQILADLSEQTDLDQIKRQQRALQTQLQQAYAQQAEVTGLSLQQTKRTELLAQQQQIQQDLGGLQQQLATEDLALAALKQLETQLQQLDNPKGKQQLLTKTLKQQATVQKQRTELEAAQASEQEQMAAIATQLTAFAQLDEQIQQQQQIKQTHQVGYLLYVQNQQAAQQVEPLMAENVGAITTLTQQQEQQVELEKHLEALNATFDPTAFSALEKQATEINSGADQLRGRLPQLKQRLDDLNHHIDRLNATAKKRDLALKELQQSDRIKRFVTFARKVYKAAGPRITERYVHNISREADRLFRELLGRANVALMWSADYEITVQEGAHTRRFINLSGGEQMCAALAVRLALLKVLADIDVAFFDEPTTNMDGQRRAGLAEAITRIKSFNQLFVISHDDTFEQVTETVIKITRAS